MAELVHVVEALPLVAVFVAASAVGASCQTDPVQYRPSLLRLSVKVTPLAGMPVAPVTASAAEPLKPPLSAEAFTELPFEGVVTDAVAGAVTSACSSTEIPAQAELLTVFVRAPHEAAPAAPAESHPCAAAAPPPLPPTVWRIVNPVGLSAVPVCVVVIRPPPKPATQLVDEIVAKAGIEMVPLVPLVAAEAPMALTPRYTSTTSWVALVQPLGLSLAVPSAIRLTTRTPRLVDVFATALKLVQMVGAVVPLAGRSKTRMRSPTWWVGVVALVVAAVTPPTYVIVEVVRFTAQLSGGPETTVPCVLPATSEMENEPDLSTLEKPYVSAVTVLLMLTVQVRPEPEALPKVALLKMKSPEVSVAQSSVSPLLAAVTVNERAVEVVGEVD